MIMNSMIGHTAYIAAAFEVQMHAQVGQNYHVMPCTYRIMSRPLLVMTLLMAHAACKRV